MKNERINIDTIQKKVVEIWINADSEQKEDEEEEYEGGITAIQHFSRTKKKP